MFEKAKEFNISGLNCLGEMLLNKNMEFMNQLHL